jgi:hypothetical protein
MAIVYDPESGQYIDDQSGSNTPSGPVDDIYTPPPAPDPVAAAPPPAAAPPVDPNAGGAGNPGATPGYDVNALRAALMAYNVPASAAALKSFIAAHPEFATGVTVGGSKGNKLYGPGGEYLADVIRGTSGSSPAWDWDSSVGGTDTGSTDPAIDPTYLAPWEGTAPTFEAPQPFSYDEFGGFDPFVAPTGESILNDPSYQFRLHEGRDALENSAAARGVLNSGGTLSDLLKYGQQFASQEYGNIFDRDFRTWDATQANKFNTYTTNRNNAASNYATNYGVSRDVFDRGVNSYQDAKDTFYKNQNNPFDKLSTLLGYGANAANGPVA